MLAERTDCLTLHIEPCANDRSRFTWSVRDGRHRVRQSLYSSPDPEAALRAGHVALREATDLWHDSHRPPNPDTIVPSHQLSGMAQCGFRLENSADRPAPSS